MDLRQQKIARAIRAEAAWQDLTLDELSKRSGIGQSTLVRKLKQPERFTVAELVKISNTLKIDLIDLVNAKPHVRQVS